MSDASMPTGLELDTYSDLGRPEKPSSAGPPSLEAELALALTDVISEDVSFVAASPVMRQVRSKVRQIANTDIPVLLLGETGTGKEIVAQLIHKLSYRAHRPLIKVNCAAVSGELLERELFGHQDGAFIETTHSKPGEFESCDKGSVLLNEIAEMPIDRQAKLSHALPNGDFSRQGGLGKANVRILAATSVDIAHAVASGKLRRDLYYRLSSYTIYLPPLRERREDVPVLLNHFMSLWAKRYSRPRLPLSPALLEACLRYPWRGNVRELQNFVRRYLIMADEAQALGELSSNGSTGRHLYAIGSNGMGVTPSDLKSQLRSLRTAVEKEAISRALELTKGNRQEAARILNISLRSLHYKIRRSCVDGRGSPKAPAP